MRKSVRFVQCASIGHVSHLQLGSKVNFTFKRLPFFSARRALLIAAAIQPDSLEMVLTRLLVRFECILPA